MIEIGLGACLSSDYPNDLECILSYHYDQSRESCRLERPIPVREQLDARAPICRGDIRVTDRLYSLNPHQALSMELRAITVEIVGT